MNNPRIDARDQESGISNPVDTIESIFAEQNWPCERLTPTELRFETSGQWCDYRISFFYRPELHALYLLCLFDTRVSASRRHETYELMTRINSETLMGHFDLADGNLRFRIGLPIVEALSSSTLRATLDMALGECERYYPCFQYLLWSPCTPEQALAFVCGDTKGTA